MCRRSIVIVLLFVLSFAGMIGQIPSASAMDARPNVAVIEFGVSKGHYLAGRELSELLINSLLETGRFRVVDRTRTQALQQEQIKVLQGTVDPATGASIGKMLGAEYLIIGTVTEFQERKTGGLGGLLSKVPGGDKVVSYRATVRFNLQVIHSTTGEVRFSKTFAKDVSDVGFSGGGKVLGIPEFGSKAILNACTQAISEATEMLIERIGGIANARTEYPSASSIPELNGAATQGTHNCSTRLGSKPPRIMVVIPEVHISRPIPDPAGETEIIRKLVGQGFNVVDQGQINVIRNREKVLTAIKNPQAAAALGVEYGADIIVIGEAFSELAQRGPNTISTRARVEARAVQTDTARIIAADGKHASGLDIAENVAAKAALRNAGGLWADYFIQQFCSTPVPATGAGGMAMSANPVEILLSDISYAQLKQFSDHLEKVSGVQSITKKLTGNMARLDVTFVGTAEKLADAIAETKFGVLRVNIIGLSGNKIEIAIGK